jgi:hypothetical protein
MVIKGLIRDLGFLMEAPGTFRFLWNTRPKRKFSQKKVQKSPGFERPLNSSILFKRHQ